MITNAKQFIENRWISVFHEFKIEKKQLLAEGTFSKCFQLECSDQFRKKCYVAKIFKSPRKLDRDIYEFESMVLHENIAQLKGIFYFNETVYCRIYDMFYKDLENFKTQQEEIFFSIAYSLNQGLNYLHNTCRIVHCDIKPSNIIFKRKKSHEIVIIDFDESIFFDKINDYDLHVSIEYRHPGLFKSPSKWNHKVDLYAAACVLYEIYEGKEFCPKELLTSTNKYNYLCSYINFKFQKPKTNCLQYIKELMISSL